MDMLMLNLLFLFLFNSSQFNPIFSICPHNCSISTCPDGLKCVRFLEDSRCCDPRDICPSGLTSESPPCRIGTKMHLSEKLDRYFCCRESGHCSLERTFLPAIPTRHLQLFGRNQHPISDKTCSKSSPDCSCEPISDPSMPFHLDRNHFGRPALMCFPPKPHLDLFPCTSNLDCSGNAFCNGREAGNEVYDPILDELVHGAGFCQVERPPFVPPAPLQKFTEFDGLKGTLTASGHNCLTHLDCLGAGEYEKYKKDAVVICNKNTFSGKGLCQMLKVPKNPCDGHQVVEPFLYCAGQDSSCENGGFCGKSSICCRGNSQIQKCPFGRTYPIRCSEDSSCTRKNSFCFKSNGTEEGFCCQTKTGHLCPDTVTNHLNEPSCINSTSSDFTSGECPIPGGVCRFGRCCPSVVFNGSHVSEIARKSYITNRPCAKSMVDNPAIHAFCDEEMGKYVVIGSQMDNDTQPTATKIRQMCQWNSECTGIDMVCVRTFSLGECYRNPFNTSLHESAREHWILLVAYLIPLVFLTFSMIFYKFYR